MKRAKITIKMILGIILFISAILILLKAMTGDFEGAILDWANSQIPFWVSLPAGLIVIGILAYMIFKEKIDDFINNFDLSSGGL